jgi:Domain of unknown function (DUF4145)
MNLKFNPVDRGNDLRNQNFECPVCCHKGSFVVLKFLASINNQFEGVAILQCPNLDCYSLVFGEIVNKNIVSTFPYKTVDFNSVDIPEKIILTFKEALGCFSNQFYVAAGVMIRKTLEELCDFEGAVGSNLHKRIEDLKIKITISNDLKDAISELKLLGNDAAHIELKDFENIGNDEIEVAIEIIKELLKSLYQQKNLVQRIKNLKKI